MKDMSTDLAEMLHAVLCNKKHEDEMIMLVERAPGYCYWYLEDNLADTWTHDDHHYWRMAAKKILDNFEKLQSTEAQIDEAIQCMLKIARAMMDFKMVNSQAYKKFVVLMAKHAGIRDDRQIKNYIGDK